MHAWDTGRGVATDSLTVAAGLAAVEQAQGLGLRTQDSGLRARKPVPGGGVMVLALRNQRGLVSGRDARSPSARGANALACIAPWLAPTPLSPSAAANRAAVSKTSGSAVQPPWRSQRDLFLTNLTCAQPWPILSNNSSWEILPDDFFIHVFNLSLNSSLSSRHESGSPRISRTLCSIKCSRSSMLSY